MSHSAHKYVNGIFNSIIATATATATLLVSLQSAAPGGIADFFRLEWRKTKESPSDWILVTAEQ